MKWGKTLMILFLKSLLLFLISPDIFAVSRPWKMGQKGSTRGQGPLGPQTKLKGKITHSLCIKSISKARDGGYKKCKADLDLVYSSRGSLLIR